ncbi:MAG: hypothetical protein ABIN72_04550 [Sphingomicrobium sp.]
MQRCLLTKTDLRGTADADGVIVRILEAGEIFELLDDTRGWAWGYAGSDRRVGYIVSSALAP